MRRQNPLGHCGSEEYVKQLGFEYSSMYIGFRILPVASVVYLLVENSVCLM